MLACYIIAVVLVSVISPVASQCDTSAKQTLVDNTFAAIALNLTAEGLMVNNAIPDANIPGTLTALCTGLKPTLSLIETEIVACSALLESATSLSTLDIKGATLADVFRAFTTVDNFCACSTKLMDALVIRSASATLVHTDADAAFTSIAAINNVCVNPLNASIHALGNLPSTDPCQPALLLIAGLNTTEMTEKFVALTGLVTSYHSDYSAAQWTCLTDGAKTNAFKQCITDANTAADEACARKDCVISEMTCDDAAKLAYMKAVNIQAPATVTETITEDCSASTVLTWSWIVIGVSLCLH